MSESTAAGPANGYIERLKESRKRPAVLKIQLVELKSKVGDLPVFAFEGDDDKIVFGHWVGRLNHTVRYEPFICNGKKGVRELKCIAARDQGNFRDNLYFFVDRDFDDLDGFPDAENVFMTETYSIENALVCEQVLDGLLRDAFPCHGLPEVREKIISIFSNDYASFLTAVEDINRRLFIARRTPIAQKKPIPTSLKLLASVEVGSVVAADTYPNAVIVLAREPSDDEVAACAHEFGNLDGRARYRGKFCLKFFEEWLRKLAMLYASENSPLFEMCPKASRVRSAEFVLSNFAAKSLIPTGLSEFIAKVS